MNILSVASEVYPLVKTGGLADVVGALPTALLPHGVRTRTLVPGYPSVLQKLKKRKKAGRFDNLFGQPATVLSAEVNGMDLLVLDYPALYDRDGGPYLDTTGLDHADNFRRFAALSLAAAEIAGNGVVPNWKPDIVHVHDWQAALAPVYMRFGSASDIPSVMTIHNIAFQGQFGASVFPELALPPNAFSTEFVEYYGDVSFLKGGLQTASAITTVSPSYAQEILTPEFGMGLDGLLASRVADLTGIVNGIDGDTWNPQTDPHIPAHYGPATLKRRAGNRKALEERFGLERGPGPIFCVISRLTWQKGMDLVAEAADDIVALGGKLVVLGSGEPALEGALMAAASRHRGHIGMVTGYDEPLSHLVQAGADAILIPSRFEPCGLTQLYGLRYGCVPVVARTGGLTDTIIDANEAALSTKCATGFHFLPVTADGLKLAIRRVMRAYNEPKLWARLQTQGMKSDVSWAKSAERYVSLYSALLAKG
ncbi:glycogen synthase GlgA [Sinorhizobium medicae]|nr:glycogen synthase GlgA [Sinorhizobium medicae]